MNFSEKFSSKLQCSCDEYVFFEIIDDIECDWGFHTVIQCPNCEDLFSIDKKCPAFQSIFELLKNNSKLFSEQEKSNYLSNSHPC